MAQIQALEAVAAPHFAVHRRLASSATSSRSQISCRSSSADGFSRFHPFQQTHQWQRAPMLVAFDSTDGHSGYGCSSNEEPFRSLPPASNSNPFQPLSKDMAMGLVFQAASGKGWTTGSGLEGPAFSDISNETPDSTNNNQWPQLTKSPRRRMRIAFTCNVCGERTMRAINPHAYTDGTVFVQCKGCNVFHKLVDNLNLFYEWDGRLHKSTTKSILPTGKFYRLILTDEEEETTDGTSIWPL